MPLCAGPGSLTVDASEVPDITSDNVDAPAMPVSKEGH